MSGGLPFATVRRQRAEHGERQAASASDPGDVPWLTCLNARFDRHSDAQIADVLGITPTTIHCVRHGKARRGILQRLKILDRIGFLHRRQWLENSLPAPLIARIRRSSQALVQQAVRDAEAA